MAEVSIARAARWLVSPIIKIMVNKARSYISSQYNWQSNMEDDLKRLETTLLQILMVVGKAEKRQTLDSSQITMLHHIKDAVYDAEDVMDEFEYLLLKLNSEHKSTVSCVGFSSLRTSKHLVGHDKFRSKLTNMLNILDGINTSAKMFLQMMVVESCNVIEQPELVQWRVTSSFLHEDKYFGRNEVREELIEKLLNEEDEPQSSNGYSPVLLSIVGIGGIGKTALAQNIYNDKLLADHFDIRIWVSVSNKFDKMRLTKEILISVIKDENIDLTNFSFNMLQEELQKKVASKKFLLVLDDVWYDEKVGEPLNKETWRELFAPLKSGERGSKILVTTRMEIVAKMLDAQRSFSLEGLEINDSWLLFRQYAFGCENPDGFPELQIISRQIVQRLAGSALAIKVVGGQLNGNRNVEEWQRVLENYVSNDIMKILRLSYERLPEHLQRCFAYCSLFPKQSVLEPDRLVDMWIAQGFVQPQTSKGLSMQDIGRGYFQDLVSRSFFQTFEHHYRTYYVMHDLMSDLALHVSEGECFRVECHSPRNVPSSVRHLYVSAENVDQLKNICELKKLRTLIFHKKSLFCSNIFLQDGVFKELESVRVLDLGGCCLKRLPDAIVHSIHLRYLAIQRPYHPLSNALCRLHHLRTLSVHHHLCFSIGRKDHFP